MTPKRKFNNANHPLNLPKKGFGEWLDKNQGGVGMGAGIAGGAVDALNVNDNAGLGALSGALKGAGSGMAFGPWGAAAGAVIGGVTSLFTQKAQERAAEKAAAEAEAKRIEGVTAANNDASWQIMRNFNTAGIDRPRAGKGGVVKMLEGGGEIDTKGYHSVWTKESQKNERLRNLAELNYYKNYWDKALESKNPEAYKKAIAAKPASKRIDHLTAAADSIYNKGEYAEKLTLEEMEKMQPEYYKRTNELRKYFANEDKVAGVGDVAGAREGDVSAEDTAWGLRNSWNVPAAARSYVYDNKQGSRYSEGEISAEYNPEDKENAFRFTDKLTKDYTVKALGGNLPPTGKKIPGQAAEYLAEGGETIQFNPGEEPATDSSGKLNRINASTSLIKGAKHSDASQGVGMTGGGRIFSDDPRLKVPKDFSKMLKKL